MEQPLLKGESCDKEDDWRSCDHVSKTASGRVPLYPTETEEVSLEEIRSASIFSESVYPLFIHHALVSSPEADHTINQLISSQPSYNRDKQSHPSNEFGRQILDEVEIRHLLIDHVGHHFFLGGYPAKKWKIISIEDCNVYVGTLETFIEEREAIKAREPYFGGKIDGKEEGVELGLWELDLRSEFPPLFMPHKETRTKIPHSELLERCSDCEGRGEIACPMCCDQQQPGYHKPNQMSQCFACHGRGLIAHQDGSDSICKKCSGIGKLPCATCGSRGLVKCQACDGQGSFLMFSTAVTQWCTYMIFLCDLRYY
ncbi:hypothetical protein HPP92_006629 [Vanilla planifolia]|uniref:Protein SSUH2 homolog n=1 Tax=Vanilla planifolia TaxID=51239 RepID=A0A835RK97_VANPL|nr:hypothetical protein HPP92_006629 [Vanilla planifolia]